jgi:hypothetical protein
VCTLFVFLLINLPWFGSLAAHSWFIQYSARGFLFPHAGLASPHLFFCSFRSASRQKGLLVWFSIVRLRCYRRQRLTAAVFAFSPGLRLQPCFTWLLFSPACSSAVCVCVQLQVSGLGRLSHWPALPASSSSFLLWFWLLQVEVGLFLSRCIKRIEGSWFKLLSHGDFLNTSTRCSMKWLWGHELSFNPIFVVNLAWVFANIDLSFRCGS